MNHITIVLDCWNFINVDVNGRGLLLKSSIETIEIHMLSKSHSMTQSEWNAGCETLTSGFRREIASPYLVSTN